MIKPLIISILLLTSTAAKTSIAFDDATFKKVNEQNFIIAVVFKNDKQISTIADIENQTYWDIWYK